MNARTALSLAAVNQLRATVDRGFSKIGLSIAALVIALGFWIVWRAVFYRHPEG